MANWLARSRRRILLVGMKSFGWKDRITPPFLEREKRVSNSLISSMPDFPFFKDERNSSFPIPIGETTPIPVTQIRSDVFGSLIDLFFFSLEVHRIFFYIPCIALSSQHLSIEFMLNQKTHDFIRSGPDHLQSRIAEETLDRIDIRIPDSTHHLHRMVDNLPEHFCRVLFCLGDHPSRIKAFVHMSCRHIDQAPCGIEFCNRIGHSKTDRFKFSDRLSKGLSPA